MNNVPRKESSRSWANASLALAGCLWGTGFLFGKIAFQEMTVAENVTFRFAFASLILIPILVRRRFRFRGNDFWMLLAISLIGVPIQFLMQFQGLKLTTVSHASLIVGTLPVLIAISSAVLLHERLSFVEWAALLLSPLGVLLIALSSRHAGSAGGASLQGDLLVLLSMVASTIMILLTKRLIRKYDSLEITAWGLTIGSIMLLLWVEVFHPLRFSFSGKAWAAAAAQGLLATAGTYLCWNWGLSRVPASRAGVFLNLEPLVGTVLGVLILHESLGPIAAVGGILILGPAIYFSTKKHEI